MSIFDSGAVYKYAVDPILSPVQNVAAAMLPSDKRIIDIACGTGAFLFKLASKSKHVIGIDHSESMINLASKWRAKRLVNNVDFILDEEKRLTVFPNNSFDIATLSMALHQFSREIGLNVLRESIRISKEILIIDYSYPLSPTIYKYIVYLAEIIAGKEHYNNFKSYMDYGGLDYYLKKTGVKVQQNTRLKTNGIFTIVRCNRC
ncbi:MAG: class I SAM-dependent methyltransferase [Spirochaetota bacterium]|nr:MAG: class I SAM-dependent methyltransferase [Spirochaetota bacterium]